MLDEFSLWKTAVYAERCQLIHGGCAQQSEKSNEMENGERRREGGESESETSPTSDKTASFSSR